MLKIITINLAAAVLFLANEASAITVTPIDLNDFFADPTVTVAPDGSSASLQENPALSVVLLSNDPGLGDPNVIIPGPGTSLIFDFVFSEPVNNDDEFGAFVIDAATGLSAGPAFEFFTQVSSSGTATFDISSLVGQTLGLQFQLAALFSDGAFDSTATVSNVRLATRMVPVPTPATLALFGLGLAGLGWSRRKEA